MLAVIVRYRDLFGLDTTTFERLHPLVKQATGVTGCDNFK